MVRPCLMAIVKSMNHHRENRGMRHYAANSSIHSLSQVSLIICSQGLPTRFEHGAAKRQKANTSCKEISRLPHEIGRRPAAATYMDMVHPSRELQYVNR